MAASLEEWASPRPVGSPLLSLPSSSWIQPEPYGVVLSISPWNYPFQLCVVPLASAIAAGNVVVVKPSEVSVHTSAIIAELLPQYLDPAAFQLVTGDAVVSTELLKLKYDFIHFTGGTKIGKIVYKAAAEHLTPVLLELGGKSPVVMASSANIDQAIRRIAWGKWSMNMGQTCIAPDYVLCTKDIEQTVIAKFKEVIEEFYSADPKTSADVSRIVTERHAERIAGMLDDPTVTIEIGGECNPDGTDPKYISPTVVRAGPGSKCMAEEIFGPILPVLAVDNIDAAIEFINRGEKPLALYAFGSRSDAAEVVNRTSSGGAMINDVVWHCGNSDLPFGGVGPSGIGSYHGKYGFDSFSHKKGVMQKGWGLGPLDADPFIRYPPFDDFKVRWLGRLRRVTKDSAKNGMIMVLVAFIAWWFSNI